MFSNSPQCRGGMKLGEPVEVPGAAMAYNRCRERGVQGSNTDFLICAVAMRHNLAIFTTDGDFEHYARALRFELHQARS